MLETVSDYARSIVIASCLALVVRALAVQAYTTPPETARLVYDFQSNDHYFLEKVSFLITKPQRGDLVVFSSSKYNMDLVSRVVGLPGERMDIAGGRIRVNGVELSEPYVLVRSSYEHALVVPPRSYFVMPDLRSGTEASAGSQTWGALREDEIAGRTWFVYWPLGRIGFIRRPTYASGQAGAEH